MNLFGVLPKQRQERSVMARILNLPQCYCVDVLPDSRAFRAHNISSMKFVKKRYSKHVSFVIFPRPKPIIVNIVLLLLRRTEHWVKNDTDRLLILYLYLFS